MSELKTNQPKCKKVMVIDDNEIDRYIAETCIQHYNFAQEVVLMDSVSKALDYLLSFKDRPEELPDIIFLDIRMPETDGFGFLDEYAKLPEIIQKKSIIMMLSSSLNQNDHSRAEESKFVDRFLTKPLSKEKLEELNLNESKVLEK